MNAPLGSELGVAAIAPPALEVLNLTKRFGDFLALDDVSLKLAPGEFHALLGENGAGKSTLAKCIMGFHRPDAGAILVNAREQQLRNTRAAQALGIGMVYQHFTLVENMTVAENLVLCKAQLPARLRWREERIALQRFLTRMPLRVSLDAYVRDLAAGEKQKVEILKQLYLNNRLLILDEPTSVLSLQEADEILGLIGAMTAAGELSVLMITHKFREVERYADQVTVLRRGKRAGQRAARGLGRDELATMMLGEQGSDQTAAAGAQARRSPGPVVLRIERLSAADDSGRLVVNDVDLRLHANEILGVAGVSGNGQRQLVEVLAGQRRAQAGSINVDGRDFRATREDIHRARLYCLPEEPLRNACVAHMSLEHNLALRNFDRKPARSGAFVSDSMIRRQAEELVARYGIKATHSAAPLHSLSGGNVQRTVLARELSQDARVLVVANPCFGLDFRATAQIRQELLQAREHGTAILLLSEDLDELLELADRLVVMSNGRINYESRRADVDIMEVGRAMTGR